MTLWRHLRACWRVPWAGVWRQTETIRGRSIGAVAVGLVAFGFIQAAGDSNWIGVEEDRRLDQQMRLQAGTQGLVDTGPPFVLVEIDDETYESWGFPAITPRDQLARLIRFAEEGGAAAIIVDIDLRHEGPDPAEDDVLARYLAELSGDPSVGPTIGFVRTVFQSTWERTVDDAEPISSKLPPSPFDPVVDENARLQWVSNGFGVEQDNVVRRPRLIEAVCRDGQPLVLPSASLLAAYLVDSERPGRQAADLIDWLQSMAARDCEAPCARRRFRSTSNRRPCCCGRRRRRSGSCSPYRTDQWKEPDFPWLGRRRSNWCPSFGLCRPEPLSTRLRGPEKR